MKIVDKKIEQKVYFKTELSQGEVYRDSSGNYVLATDEKAVVDLSDGAYYDLKSDKWYTQGGQFTLVNAVLEIQ